MSIKSEIAKSASYLRSARKAILGRGGEISLTAGLKDLPDAIYKIPADASLAYQVDDSVAYRKIVPSGAEEFAQVNKIGGMTYKSKNLIPFPYDFTEPKTAFGVTWTPNADGSITANGTQTSSGSIGLFVNNTNPIFFNGTYSASLGATLPSGCNLYLSATDGLGNVNIISASSSGKATITNRYITNIRFWISSGAVFNNVTFYPMLNEGDTALPYEPYFEGLRDTAVTELKSEGANLIKPPNEKTFTENGVIFTVQDDGTVIVNGTATATTNFRFDTKGGRIFLEKGKTYILSGAPEGDSATTYRLIVQDISYNQNFSNGTPSVAQYTQYYAFIRVYAGYTANNLIFKPMLNEGSTPAPYKPYRAEAIDTLPIPEEIQALDGYGIGKSETEYNYLDFENNVFKQDYGKVRLLSTLGGYNADNNWYYIGVSSLGIAPTSRNMLCNLLPSVDIVAYAEADGIYVNPSFTHITLRKSDFTTQAEYRQWLADNEVYIIEKLATPIETDISAYLGNDNFIAVEGGGSITAVNEYEYDAPSTINYIAKVGT